MIPQSIKIVFGCIGIVLELFTWNLWYFMDAFRALTALMVWSVFRNLNRALTNGKLTLEHLPDVT